MTELSNQAGLQVNPRAIAKYVGLDPNDERSHAVIAVCERYGLDPVLKHIIVLPKGGAYITRDGYLHVAHKSGQLDGIVLEDQGITEDGRHHYAVVSVYRKDMSHPFKFTGRYPVDGHNKKYAPEMAVKNAEVQGLRRAFDVAGLPAADEQQPIRKPTPPPIPPTPTPKPVADVADETETETTVIDDLTGEIIDAELLEPGDE